MVNAEKVLDYLQTNRGKYYCDDSLSDLTKVGPANQVNQITRPLMMQENYKRSQTRCSHCGRDRLCTAYVGR